MASLSCETIVVVDRVGAYCINEVGPFVVYGVRGGFETVGCSTLE